MENQIILSKESSESDLRKYFEAVLQLSERDEQFPVNLDDVWPLVYSRRDRAVATLKQNFFENEDFVVFHQNVENLEGWKSRARLTPEGKAALTPENLLFLTPLKS